MPHDVLVAFWSLVIGASFWPLWRLFHPWRCACGRVHWSSRKMMRHVELKHVVK